MDKLELLTTWLPAQSWYLGGGRAQARGILATAEHMPGPRPADH